MAYGPRAYAATATAASGTTKAIILLGGVTTTRPGLYDIILGTDAAAAPADVGLDIEVVRTTADGTPGSAGTEDPLDEDGPVALCDVQNGAFSVEPTKGNVILNTPMNSRATFRWVAAPGSELQIQAVATDGIAIQTAATNGGTPNLAATILWKE